MAFLAKYGTIWGTVPIAVGRVFFVAPSTTYYLNGYAYNASDSVNDGLAPERALATIARALLLAGISSGNPIDSGGSIATTTTSDTIVLLPGTHVQTAQLRMQAAGVTLTGLARVDLVDQGASQSSQDTIIAMTGTSKTLLSIEASNIVVANLMLRPTTGFSTVVFRNSPTVDNLRFRNVIIDMFTPAANLNTIGFDFAYRANSDNAAGNGTAKGSEGIAGTPYVTAYIENCTIWSRDGQGRGVDQATAAVTYRRVHFKHTQNGTWASPFVLATGCGGSTSLMEDCLWTTQGTMSTCIDGAFAGSTVQTMMVNRAFFPATTTTASPISRTTANVIQAAGCRQAGQAGLAQSGVGNIPIEVQPISVQ